MSALAGLSTVQSGIPHRALPGSARCARSSWNYDRRLDLDQKVLMGKTRNADLRWARQVVAKYLFQTTTDGIALMHIVIVNVELERHNVFEGRAHHLKDHLDTAKALDYLGIQIILTDSLPMHIPSNVPYRGTPIER